MAAQGRDIKLSTQRVEGYRNFATKLWNAARFAEMNGCASAASFDPKSAKETLNRWIAHETAKAAAEITEAIEAYRFNDAATAVYRFVWNIYCDWYLELAKPLLIGPDGAAKSETQAMVAWARDEILKLLQPFMPFITEELWAVTGKHDALLALDAWPSYMGLSDDKAEAEIGWVIDLVTAIRSVRAEMNITAAIPLVLAALPPRARCAPSAGPNSSSALRACPTFRRGRRAEGLGAACGAGEVAALPLKGVIDLAAERARLAKEMQKADADIARVDAKLSNANLCRARRKKSSKRNRKSAKKRSRRKTKIAEALDG
jgi:valyl-tRNA synthetase